MKAWFCWVILIIGISGIALISYWLTSTLSFWWSNGIVIIMNFIVSIYLAIAKCEVTKYENQGK